jgi:ParB/RepB/Spo0J family partition protein
MTTVLDPLTANTGADFVRMRVDLIDPNPDNPRRVDDKHPSLPGLAEAIKATGLINPITVRQVGSRCLILAGERRWRAARIAGLAEILVRVVDVTDEQAFHILNVENLQREDLHWTEEARGVEAMLAKGWTAESIAKAVGRTVQWVAVRRALLTLSPAWKKELANPKGDWHAVPLNKLELIARFPHPTQDLIRDNLDSWDFDHQSVKDFEAQLEANYLRPMSKAAWKLDDAKLVPKAGACSACPKRSSCQQQLFADAKDDRCLDAACWRAKQDATVIAKVEAARAADPKTLLLKDGYVDDESPEQIKRAGYLHAHKEVAKSDRGALPAVIVNGAKAGQTIYVKPDPVYSSTTHNKAKPAGPKSVKERLAAVEKRRANVVVLSFLNHLEKEKTGATPATLDPLKLFTLCLAWGVGDPHLDYDPTEGAIAQATKLRKAPTSQLLEVAWNLVAEQVHEAIGYQYRAGNPPSSGVEALCMEFGWMKQLASWQAKALDEVPMPKALAADLALAEAKKPPAKPKAKTAAAKR